MSVTDERCRRWGLNGHDRRKLRAAMGRTAKARHLRRLQAVWLLASGYDLDAICRLAVLSRQSVYNALHRYRLRRDPADLADRPRCGRPRSAPNITDQHIVAAAEQLDPRRVGFNATTWTVALLARYLSAHHGGGDGQAVGIGPRALRRRMHALGLRWKRPRYVYHLRDPHAPQKKGALCGV